MSKFDNVGELKKLLENFSDDTPIVGYHQDMECRGYFEGGHIKARKFQLVKKSTWDRFDGTDYKYECYEPSDNGKVCVVIDF